MKIKDLFESQSQIEITNEIKKECGRNSSLVRDV